MSAQPEIWRVSTVEGQFEADLLTLQQWIREGCVLPTDKVCKGNLSWIDAGRVPQLREAFAAERIPFDPAQATTPQAEPNWQAPPPIERGASSQRSQRRVTDGRFAAACHNHPGTPPHYLCRMCGTAFCQQCPKFAGQTKIPLCPLCGDFCRPYEEVRNKIARAEFQSSGFGIDDFVRSIRYPFDHKAALLGGALVYGLLLLAGFRGSLIAWMIMFGCISHVISQVAWGRLHRSFMPDFSEFSLVDDIVVPFFLGVGITIVSWGPTIALILALIFGVISSGVISPASQVVQVPSAQSSGLTSADLDVLVDPDADPKKLEEANKKLQETQAGSVIAREAEKSKAQQDDPAAMARMFLPYLGAGIFVVLLLIVFLLWGFFYYPMALTVAGYTQSFAAVINPLVGIDTIRRMRGTYFKAFGMVVVVQITAAIISGIVSLILSPFTLPFIGNLFANFLNGTVTFYFNLVTACVLGLSLYKCADRLGINVD